MKLAKRISFVLLFAAIALAVGVSIFTAVSSAQNNGWSIVRAEYGTGQQHNDVTEILKDLIRRGGVDGRVVVSNQTMGGDPAVGADKLLIIFARNGNNEERQFRYKEGSFVEVTAFNVRREDWDDRRGPEPGPRDDNSPGLVIIRGYYGIQGRTVNVTDVLRGRVRGGTLSLPVRNEFFGGDPAIGADKVLIVVYRFQGVESATAVREGNMLTLP
jgi:hypothetical protein